MFTLHIPEKEYFDQKTGEFINIKACTLQLEHSLISLSKWESKWKKAFLSLKEPTVEELQDYVRCMTINQGVDPKIYHTLNMEQLKEVGEYIGDNHTATVITDYRKNSGAPSRQFITSELIYSWMVDYGIPFSCDKWNLGRLLTLIRICNVRNSNQKMSLKDLYSHHRAIDIKNRARMGL